MQSADVLSAAEVRLLVDTLERAARPSQADKIPGEEEDFFGKDLVQPVAKKPVVREPRQLPQLDLQPVEEKIGLTRKQWVVIALMAVGAVTALGLLIFYLLYTM
jgi:hypothetical protein